MKLIKKTLTHLHPHLDEYFAGLLAKMFGMNQFHILSNVTYEEVCVADKSVNSLAKENPHYLCLGIGGADSKGVSFDDHGIKSHKSASSLMAEYIGVDIDPRLIVPLELITRQDKGTASSSPDQFTLPRAINFMHRYGYESKLIREWVEQGLRGLIDSEALLLEEIKVEIGRMASQEAFQSELKTRFLNRKRKWEHFNINTIAELVPNGCQWLQFAEGAFQRQSEAFQKARCVAKKCVKPLNTKFGEIRILSIDGSKGEHSAYEVEFDACSRLKEVNADLVFVRNSQGHTLIAANKNFKGNLAGLVKDLRIAEATKRGQEIPAQYHIVEGMVPDERFTTWYVHEGIGYMRVYSGTTTRPIGDLSELSPEEIQERILNWLQTKKFVTIKISENRVVDLERAFKKAADAG